MADAWRRVPEVLHWAVAASVDGRSLAMMGAVNRSMRRWAHEEALWSALVGSHDQAALRRAARPIARLELEEHLLEAYQEETLRLAIDAADVGTWDHDLETDDIRLSDRCYTMFGVRPGELITRDTLTPFTHPADVQRVQEAVERALDPAVRADYAIEFRVNGRDDHVERWLSVKGKVFFDERKVYDFNLLPEDGHKRPAFINLQQYYLELGL